MYKEYATKVEILQEKQVKREDKSLVAGIFPGGWEWTNFGLVGTGRAGGGGTPVEKTPDAAI